MGKRLYHGLNHVFMLLWVAKGLIEAQKNKIHPFRSMLYDLRCRPSYRRIHGVYRFYEL
ncbi:MAG: hypothetical protein RR555_03775 [Bacteroidales bacterium]